MINVGSVEIFRDSDGLNQGVVATSLAPLRAMVWHCKGIGRVLISLIAVQNSFP